MKILISAYASEPGAGSEYGVGWMVPLTMATNYPEHEIFVITRSRCCDKIDQALKENKLSNLHYFYYDIPNFLFYKAEMQSKWGEQINYLLWQIMVKSKLRKLHKALHFDVFHHLTFNQYRTPSPGFWLDLPFVFGPIGGAETISETFWQDLNEHTRKKESIRINGKDRQIFRWFTKRNDNKKVVLCSCEENMIRLKDFAKECEMRILPAIGFQPSDFADIPEINKTSEDSFEMIYAGKAFDWKGIHIYLKSVKKAFIDNDINRFHIKLIGIRFKEEQQMVMNWIKELGLDDKISLIPFINRSELLSLEKNCTLAVYPAFRDPGSMSVSESCALGCPCICFNAGGQDVFPDNILIKVPIEKSYEETVKIFSQKLLWAYYHKNEIKELGRKAKSWVHQNMTWEKKAHEFMDIYRSISNN